jgi:hypothetical protein
VPLASDEDIEKLLSEVMQAPQELKLDDSAFHSDPIELATIRSFVDSSQKYAKHALGE